MTKTRLIYNPILDNTERYTEIWETELVTARGVKDLPVKNHYWKQNSNGELWLDFDNPDENFYAFATAFRKEMNYMTPGEIQQLCLESGLGKSLFASLLSMDEDTLDSLMSNDLIQDEEQESLLEAMRSDVSGFSKIATHVQGLNMAVDLSEDNSHESALTYNVNSRKEEKSFAYNVELGRVA